MLEDAVEVWVKFNYPNEDGISQHDLVEQHEKRLEMNPNLLIPISGAPQRPEFDLPFDSIFLWELFLELGSSREVGMGQNPIYYREIDAWSRLTGIKLSNWEIQLLRKMDAKYLRVISEFEKKKIKKKK